MFVVRSGSGKAFSALCRLPLWFGVFPYRYKNNKFLLFRPALIFSISFISVLSIQAMFLAKYPSPFYTYSTLIHLIYIVEQFSVRVAMYATIYWVLRHRLLLNRILSLFTHFDNLLMYQGEVVTYKFNYYEELLMSICVGSLAFMHIYNRPKDLWNLSKVSTYYTSMYVICVIAIQFKRIVLLIACGIAALKKCLYSSLERKILTNHSLEVLLINFDNLYTILCSFNKLFNPQLLIIIFISFLITTANSYFFYQSLALKETYAENIIRIGWIVVFSMVGHQIVTPCRMLTIKAKEFNALLYQIMIDDKSNEIANNKKLRIHIAMKREFSFTACGFFNLDYSLIHSMIAAATTYLVILVQFGQPTFQDRGTSETQQNVVQGVSSNYSNISVIY